MIKLKFEDTEEGRKRYEICSQALLLTQRKVDVSEWDEVIDLVKAIKDAGTKTSQQLNGIFLYDLMEGGAEVNLEKAEAKLLVSFIRQPMWRPEGVAEAKSVALWVEEIKDDRASAKKDARPEARRDAPKSKVLALSPKVDEPEESVESLEARLADLKARQNAKDETTGADRS